MPRNAKTKNKAVTSQCSLQTSSKGSSPLAFHFEAG
jgi:hypothetical protein